MPNATLDLIQGLLWSKGLHVGKLNPGNRAMAAMMGVPDMVPFAGAQSHDHCMMVARVPARKFYWDAELHISTQMAVQRWYEMDGYTVIAGLGGRDLGYAELGQRVRAAAGARLLVDGRAIHGRWPADRGVLARHDRIRAGRRHWASRAVFSG